MQASRRQILEDMGIVAWQLRVAQRPAAAAPADPAPAPAPQAAPEAVPADPAAALAGAPEPQPEPRSRPEPDSESPPPVAAWSALSLALADVVLLVDGDSSRRDLRLAMDVLAAASGDWGAKPASRRFDWPPDGSGGVVSGGAAAAGRAFAAFVDKDLTDHQGSLLVCTAPLAEQLPEVPGASRVVIPALDQLGRDVDAKRALWQALRSRHG